MSIPSTPNLGFLVQATVASLTPRLTCPPPHAALLSPSLKKATVEPFWYLTREQSWGRLEELTVALLSTLPPCTWRRRRLEELTVAPPPCTLAAARKHSVALVTGVAQVPWDWVLYDTSTVFTILGEEGQYEHILG